MFFSKIVEEDIKEIIDYCTPELLLEKLKGKTVLITGATGMIGSYFLYTLIELNKMHKANIKIKALVRDMNKVDFEIREMPCVEFIIQDVIKEIKLEKKLDYIIHAASPASPKIMEKYPVETNFANTIGTANTLKLALEKKSRGYLFISSREIYGEPNSPQEEFFEEGILGQVDPLIPRNAYAEGKKAAENMCVSFKEEYGLNTKIARLAHTYGPGMSMDDGRVQADFLRNILYNEDIILKSDGSSIRTYTYVADSIKAMLLILLKSNDVVYNIANEDCKVSIRELAEILVNMNKEKDLKLKFDIVSNNKGYAPFKNGILSTLKIRSELGWTPKYGIEEGFSRTIKHLRQELNIK